LPDLSTSPNVSVQIFEEQTNRIDGGWVGSVATAALDGIGKAGEGLSIVITDDETVAELNKTHRGLDETTDVLSFSYAHSGTYYGTDEQAPNSDTDDDFVLPPEVNEDLGEIVISYPQAERQATEAGHSVENELAVLLAHGILHLLGYDHENGHDAAKMKTLEVNAFDSIVSGGLLQDREPGS
jgi:rRNA maturation RNase YbeY